MSPQLSRRISKAASMWLLFRRRDLPEKSKLVKKGNSPFGSTLKEQSFLIDKTSVHFSLSPLHEMPAYPICHVPAISLQSSFDSAAEGLPVNGKPHMNRLNTLIRMHF